MKRLVMIILALVMIAVGGCTQGGETPETAGAMTAPAPADNVPVNPGSYRQISQQTAMEMMSADDGHIVVDVRRQDEFDSGHIAGAICIPNETIDTVPPDELPDPDQIILVYCRSGRRSKEAAQKLYDMGYDNVYEFGGIIDWIYGTVTDGE